MLYPRLKSFTRFGSTGDITLVRESGTCFQLADPTGQVATLLDLCDGTRSATDIHAALRDNWPELALGDVTEGIAALDTAGLLENERAANTLDDRQRARYASNLAFFGTFASCGRSRYAAQEALRRAHVVQLGVGGVGSSVLYNLAGLGVGRITTLDCDVVELKNLSRQFLYDENDVGRSKIACAAARVRALNSEVTVTPVERQVTGPADIADLLPGADLLISVIDQPLDVQSWVNEAAVAAGVPVIAGGMTVTRGVYWSVSPGASGCLACRSPKPSMPAPVTVADRVNRAIGPAAGVIGSLIALEAVRYLTGFAPPISAATLWRIDLATSQVEIGETWQRRPDCPVCRHHPISGEGGQA
jgi:molybdopterin/thiamine biosynthesis adenylyltransferase